MLGAVALLFAHVARVCLGRRRPEAGEPGPGPGALVVHLADGAAAPARAHAGDAGLDLRAAAPASVPARGRAKVRTGVRLRLPTGTYGRVASRSGLSVRHGIEVGAGTIDADYTGEVGVVLHNFSDCDFAVAAGDRVAQLVVQRVELVDPVVVDADEWADLTEGAGRGDAGFGSTGVAGSPQSTVPR